MACIRDQAVNVNSKTNNHIDNAWYRGCHDGYMGNFGNRLHIEKNKEKI